MHTVALPDPTEVMSDRFRHSPDELISENVAAIAELIEEEQDRFFDSELGVDDLDVERQFEESAPPRELLDQPVHTAADLRSTLAALDPRWRLDALLA